MAANSMGQYRYSGSGCIDLVSHIIDYKDIPVSTTVSGLSETNFKDIYISPANGQNFVQNQDYLVRIQIPQDMNYSYSFEVMLVKADGSLPGKEEFQYIKTIILKQGGTGNNIYDVVLYETNTPNVDAAMIPKKIHYTDDRLDAIEDHIYYGENTGLYYLGQKDGKYKLTSKYNHVQVAASWKEEQGIHYGYFEFGFRPILNEFNQLVFRIVRDGIDYNVQTIENEKIELGRKIDINQVKSSLYKMNNLIPQMTTVTNTLSRIGVWSHPGLLMMVNGEEIKITANGYYELDVLPITSLAIAANNAADKITDDKGNPTGEVYGYQDFFTVDYEYEVPSG